MFDNDVMLKMGRAGAVCVRVFVCLIYRLKKNKTMVLYMMLLFYVLVYPFLFLIYDVLLFLTPLWFNCKGQMENKKET